MATSGISCSDEAIDAFNNFKLRKGGRFIVFKIGPHPETKEDRVIVEHEGPSDASYDDMLSKFPDDDCRYAVFDYHYEQDGRQQDKIIFINWVPDSSGIKRKMLYSSTKGEMKRAFTGIGKDLQATDRDEVSEASLRSELGL